MPCRDAVAMEGAERLELLPLRLGGDESLAAPIADSDVAVEVHAEWSRLGTRVGFGTLGLTPDRHPRLAALVVAQHAGHVCHHMKQGRAEGGFLRCHVGVAVALGRQRLSGFS